MTRPLRPLKLLPDVSAHRRGDFLYLCSSRTTLRLPAEVLTRTGAQTAVGGSNGQGTEEITDRLLTMLSTELTEELVRRGLAAEEVPPALPDTAMNGADAAGPA